MGVLIFQKVTALLSAFLIALTPVAPVLAPPNLVNKAFAPNPVMSEIAAAINRVAAEYSEVRGITVTEVDIMPGVYAYASGRLIAFNRLYTPSVDVFNALMASDIGAGFHPALGRCTPAEFLAYHESAHIIDRTRELAPRIAMAVRYGERSDLDLSGYSFRGGVLNLGEALAEAFAATLCGSANPTEREIYTLFTEDL